jgi:hypothetical protein
MIMDVIKDYLIPHTYEKKMKKEIFGCPIKPLPLLEHKYKYNFVKQTQIHRDDQIRFSHQFPYEGHTYS